MSAPLTKADEAVNHILCQMQRDGRLAYLIGFGSQSFDLLTAAYAERTGEDVAAFRTSFHALLKPERVVAEQAA